MSQTYQNRPVVAVDIVALNGLRSRGSSHVLLIKRDHEPYEGFWALPGGRLEPNEDLVPAAIREFREEVGIEIFAYDLGQLGAYGKPGRDPRGDNLSVAFVVTMGRKVPPFAGDDAREARWFDLSELPPLAFDHAQVINDAIHDERF